MINTGNELRDLNFFCEFRAYVRNFRKYLLGFRRIRFNFFRRTGCNIAKAIKHLTCKWVAAD